jgi:ribulose-phosphate 3-epimerase
VRVAPSVIAADFTRYQEEIQHIVDAGIDLLHLDVMDGVFVPNITFGPMIVEAINALTDVELDAHLMIVQPEKYIGQFIDAGVDWLSFHAEATDQTDAIIDQIHERGINAGLALNPETPFEYVTGYIEKLDYLLIMTVNPGFYGQKFMSDVLHKIEAAKKYIENKGLNCLLEVDGGINVNNVGLVNAAGADMIVAGAGVFKADDYRAAIRRLQCSTH